jgi:hypothetical protein
LAAQERVSGKRVALLGRRNVLRTWRERVGHGKHWRRMMADQRADLIELV